MESNPIDELLQNLQMQSEEFYRDQAFNYKRSDEYQKMVSLYPALENSIGLCVNEELIN